MSPLIITLARGEGGGLTSEGFGVQGMFWRTDRVSKCYEKTHSISVASVFLFETFYSPSAQQWW